MELLLKEKQLEARNLSNTGFTPLSLNNAASQAHLFHRKFLAIAEGGKAGVRIPHMPEWGEKLVRRSGSIPQAVLEKLGSNSFLKRRPKNVEPFLSYLQKRYNERVPIHFRLVVGPVKNVSQCGANQTPDLAEYLMFIQLARVIEAIASLYPYGIKVQMIPDNMRGGIANCWPASYSMRYISGLQQMAKDLRFCSWLDVEDGQSRLYELYEVEKYFKAAKEDVMGNPDYLKNLTTACLKAKQNFVARNETEHTECAICDSAMRYLVSHKAEILSGMWSPEDAFPLIYANHPGSYQLYTMGRGLTKLPWQISLPFSVCDAKDQDTMFLPKEYPLSACYNHESYGRLNA